jgi:HlyD family secretion protein
MSKDIRTGRLYKTASPWKRAIGWLAVLVICGGGGYAAYRYGTSTEISIATARVRRGDFVVAIRARGEIRSTRSVILTAPQVPTPRITKLAESGKPVKKGDVVVEFDTAQQEQNWLDRDTAVKTTDSATVQTKASHTMTNESDALNLMTNTFDLERAKLEASKAEILSEIEGAKDRLDVGLAEGNVNQTQMQMKLHKVSQQADLLRLKQQKDKNLRDLDRAATYLSGMVIRAPIDGIINILPNQRTSGFGSSPPPFKEGDNAWTGAAIAEIPDLSSMRVELKLEEVDRGRTQLGYPVRVRVDAIADKDFDATIDWISPIAQLNFSRMASSEKLFPAYATLKLVDPRLRPGMSATAEIITERKPGALLIPVKASFLHNGKPAVYVQQGDKFVIRQIQVGERNDNDIIVLKGLSEGETVTLESPEEAAKRAKKL